VTLVLIVCLIGNEPMGVSQMALRPEANAYGAQSECHWELAQVFGRATAAKLFAAIFSSGLTTWGLGKPNIASKIPPPAAN